MNKRHDRPETSLPPGRRTRRRAALVAALAVALLLSLGASLAGEQPEQDYDLSWWSADGGGSGLVQAGAYRFGGSAGQPDAGELVTATYTLRGGFWAGAWAAYSTYLPTIMHGRE